MGSEFIFIGYIRFLLAKPCMLNRPKSTLFVLPKERGVEAMTGSTGRNRSVIKPN
jgi:hypothetical protein